jgi:flagellar protein FlaG
MEVNPLNGVESSAGKVASPENKPIEKIEGFESPEKVLQKKTKPGENQEKNEEKNEEKLREAVDKINKTAVIFDRSLRFQIHEATHRTMVSVVDVVNDKVIRQIPEKEVLDLVAKMQDYIGLIFDKKA